MLLFFDAESDLGGSALDGSDDEAEDWTKYDSFLVEGVKSPE